MTHRLPGSETTSTWTFRAGISCDWKLPSLSLDRRYQWRSPEGDSQWFKTHIYIYILYRIFKISLLNLEEIPSLINGQAQKALRAASDQRGEESSELSSDQVKKKPAGRGGLKRPSSSRGGRGRGRGRGRNPAKPVPDLLKRPASASSSKPPKKTKTSEDYWILFVFFNIIKIDHRSWWYALYTSKFLGSREAFKRAAPRERLRRSTQNCWNWRVHDGPRKSNKARSSGNLPSDFLPSTHRLPMPGHGRCVVLRMNLHHQLVWCSNLSGMDRLNLGFLLDIISFYIYS